MEPTRDKRARLFQFSWRDTLATLGILSGAVALCYLLRLIDDGSIYVSMLFMLAVVLISRFTSGYFYGLVASFFSVFCVNYIFTYPYYDFNFTISGYPLTFITMLLVSAITSTITTQAREKEKMRAAAEAERIRANLLRSVSHDLRTPLTSILGTSSALLENDERIERDKRLEMLRAIQTDTDWLIRMVENLLSITRMGEGAAVISKRGEAVEEIMAEAVRKFRGRFPSPPVFVAVPEEYLEAPMDPILIEQVIGNLLENVVHHAQTATRIDLSVRREGNFAVFEVKDDGRGFDPAVLTTLFDGGMGKMSGARGDRSRNMGIGLSVCLSVVKAHGGRMCALTSAEGGARVQFTLPLNEGESQ